jgi:hypothetical protein
MKTAALFAAALALAALPAAAQDASAWALSLPKKPADTAYLSFRAFGAADETFGLSCQVKTGQIIVHAQIDKRPAASLRGDAWIDEIGRPAPWPVSVTVVSGAAQTTVPGRIRPDDQGDGSGVSVELSDRAPVLAEFGKTGVLSVRALDAVAQVPPASKRDAGRFLRACRS